MWTGDSYDGDSDRNSNGDIGDADGIEDPDFGTAEVVASPDAPGSDVEEEVEDGPGDPLDLSSPSAPLQSPTPGRTHSGCCWLTMGWGRRCKGQDQGQWTSSLLDPLYSRELWI